MERRLATATLLAILATASPGCPTDEPDPGAAVVALASLRVDGAARPLFPPFDPSIELYAWNRTPGETVTVTVTAADPEARVSVAGGAAEIGGTSAVINDPEAGEDVEIIVTGADGSSARTLVRVLPWDFPTVDVQLRTEEATDGWIFVSPKFKDATTNESVSYLMIMNNHGVPGWYRKTDAAAQSFRLAPDGTMSYSSRIGEVRPGYELFWESVLLDELGQEVRRVTTQGLEHTDGHEFFVAQNGNHVFVAHEWLYEDMTAFGLGAATEVGNSVIQEVTPDGEVVMHWSTWDHMDLNDCLISSRFPIDYAHVNSVYEVEDGDLVASFRGCGQVLRIDRESGDVKWRIGSDSSDLRIVGDPYDEFCGQHSASLVGDRLMMFDNGQPCHGPRNQEHGVFSRVAAWDLDLTSGTATHAFTGTLRGTNEDFAWSQGSAAPIGNGHTMVSWGAGIETSISELDAEGDEVFRADIRVGGNIAVTYRAYLYPDYVLPEGIRP